VEINKTGMRDEDGTDFGEYKWMWKIRVINCLIRF
jgi:hypothetical protein